MTTPPSPPSPHTLTTLLAEASADSWLLNNLYQLDTGIFRCNFRRDNLYTPFAYAPDPLSAIAAAINLLPYALEGVTPTSEPTYSITPTIDLRDLLFPPSTIGAELKARMSRKVP